MAESTFFPRSVVRGRSSSVAAIKADGTAMTTTSDASITKAKGVGEGGLIGAPASVINAIVDALSPFGIEIFEMPATPQRILDHIRGKRTT